MSIPTVDYAYFASIFPELASTPSAVVTALDPVARFYVSESVYGQAGQYAVALAIAHLVTLGMQKGAGPISSEGIGDLSVACATLSTENSMQMTSYGMRLRELGRMLRPGGVFVGGSPTGVGVPAFGGYQPTWTWWTSQWRAGQ